MLIPAVNRKEDVYVKFAEILYTEDYWYYVGWAGCHDIPKIEPEDDRWDWISVDKTGEICGFMSYHIDPVTDRVSHFGIISFNHKSIIFAQDFKKKMDELVKEHHTLEWRMIGGNPVKKHYDAFCKKYNGSCHEYHDVCRDLNGKYRNEYVYEIKNNTTT